MYSSIFGTRTANTTTFSGNNTLNEFPMMVNSKCLKKKRVCGEDEFLTFYIKIYSNSGFLGSLSMVTDK